MTQGEFETSRSQDERRAQPPQAAINVILVGAMGAGKSTVGWHLARLAGLGFIDVDRLIERREKKSIEQIFDGEGEAQFRDLERQAIASLEGVRSHVLAVGGGAVMDQQSWGLLKGMGIVVWLNPPPSEIARRIGDSDEALAKRPLLSDLVNHKDRETRHRLLSERMAALVGHRAERYREADLVVEPSFSTPEATARVVKDGLFREGWLVASQGGGHPLDKWRIL